VGPSDRERTRPFSSAIVKWKHVAGGFDTDGNVIRKPLILQQAEFIDNLCQRYSCVPSVLMGEDADLIMFIQNVIAEANPEDKEGSVSVPSMEDQLAGISTGIG